MRDLVNGAARHRRVPRPWSGTQVLVAVFLALWVLALIVAVSVDGGR